MYAMLRAYGVCNATCVWCMQCYVPMMYTMLCHSDWADALTLTSKSLAWSRETSQLYIHVRMAHTHTHTYTHAHTHTHTHTHTRTHTHTQLVLANLIKCIRTAGVACMDLLLLLVCCCKLGLVVTPTPKAHYIVSIMRARVASLEHKQCTFYITRPHMCTWLCP